MSVRLGPVTGDPPCPDCTGPSVGGPDDPHQTVYTICPDGMGGYSGDGCTFTEDPSSPGDWLLVACGINFSFLAWPGFPGVAPGDVGSQGGPITQPGPCFTNAAATIYRTAFTCMFGTLAMVELANANNQAAPIFDYYGYSGPYTSEANCEANCPASMGFAPAATSAVAPPVPSVPPLALPATPGKPKDCGCGKRRPAVTRPDQARIR